MPGDDHPGATGGAPFLSWTLTPAPLPSEWAMGSRGGGWRSFGGTGGTYETDETFELLELLCHERDARVDHDRDGPATWLSERECVGIEPTRPLDEATNGFEDRGAHQHSFTPD